MDLRQFTIFSPLQDTQLAQVASALRVRHYDRQEVVCRKGEPSDGLYLLASGRLQVIEITEDGREIGLNYIMRGAFFGELSVIDDLPRSAHIVTIERSVVGCLPQSAARELFYTIPAMAEAMMRHLTGMVRAMSQQRVILAIPNAYQRVYAHLLNLAREAPGGLVVVQDLPKQQQMAIMLNTSRETVSRAIGELVQHGIVEKDLRRLIIRRPDLLQAWAQSSEAFMQGKNHSLSH